MFCGWVSNGETEEVDPVRCVCVEDACNYVSDIVTVNVQLVHIISLL